MSEPVYWLFDERACWLRWHTIYLGWPVPVVLAEDQASSPYPMKSHAAYSAASTATASNKARINGGIDNASSGTAARIPAATRLPVLGLGLSNWMGLQFPWPHRAAGWLGGFWQYPRYSLPDGSGGTTSKPRCRRSHGSGLLRTLLFNSVSSTLAFLATKVHVSRSWRRNRWQRHHQGRR